MSSQSRPRNGHCPKYHPVLQHQCSPSGRLPVVIQSFLSRVMMRSDVATTDARDSPAATHVA